jgi:N-acetylmuramoyl-L-alanine amidase
VEIPETEARSETVPAQLMSTVTVIVRKANVRESPTRQSQVITVAKRNQQFWLLNEEGGWYQVWLPHLKQKGWISGRIVARLRKE